MQYPWFVCYQKITGFVPTSKQMDVEVWINSLEVNDTERLGVYAGDSEGSIIKFKAPKEWRTKCEFEFEKKFPKVHRSGIIQVLDVQKESMTFSIGYD